MCLASHTYKYMLFANKPPAANLTSKIDYVVVFEEEQRYLCIAWERSKDRNVAKTLNSSIIMLFILIKILFLLAIFLVAQRSVVLEYFRYLSTFFHFFFRYLYLDLNFGHSSSIFMAAVVILMMVIKGIKI